MTEKIENLILEHLKSLRNELRDLRKDMDNNFRDVKLRLGSIERYQVGCHDDSVRQNARIDDLDERIQRLEQRLEIREDS